LDLSNLREKRSNRIMENMEKRPLTPASRSCYGMVLEVCLSCRRKKCNVQEGVWHLEHIG
jgi:hypothetical protein